MTAVTHSRIHVQGIVCVLIAILALSLQDMIIKVLSPRFPLHQIVLWRAIIAIVLTVIAAHFEGGIGVLKTKHLGLNLVRGLLLVFANLFFFLALAAMPLAEAVAIFFIAPIFITALSVPILGEHVGIRRWIAVLAGLSGVVIMVRPFDGTIEIATVLPVLAALSYALTQMMTRRLGAVDRASTLAFYIQLSFIVVSVAIGLAVGHGDYAGGGHPSLEFLLRSWSWPDGHDALLLSACGFLVAVGAYLLSQAYRLAEANIMAPFEYVALPMAVMWGYLIWGDLPDTLAWVGIALIVGSGLFVLYRESLPGRRVWIDRLVRRNL